MHQHTQRIGVEAAAQFTQLHACLLGGGDIEARGRQEGPAGIEMEAGDIELHALDETFDIGHAGEADTVRPVSSAAWVSSVSRPSTAAPSSRRAMEVTPPSRSSRICALATAGSGCACSWRMSQPASALPSGCAPRTNGG